ncbi:hypothetical protein ACFL6Y_06830, partial [Elusimicrobiota bacterium]
AITYTLLYSGTSDFAQISTAAGLTVTSCREVLPAPSGRTRYYWRVKALDIHGAYRISFVSYFDIGPEHHVYSRDGVVGVEILSGLPANSYVSVDNVTASGNSMIQAANTNISMEPMLALLPVGSYKMELLDSQSGALLDSSGLQAKITFTAFDQDNNGLLDGSLVPVDSIVVSRLDESEQQWKRLQISGKWQSSDQTVSVTVQGFSYYTLVGFASAENLLDNFFNFPNPFAAGMESTRIRYTLTEDAKVTLRCYTPVGDLVYTKRFEPGSTGGQGQAGGYTNEIIWDGRNNRNRVIANGMYLCEIAAEAGGSKHKSYRKIGVLK